MRHLSSLNRFLITIGAITCGRWIGLDHRELRLNVVALASPRDRGDGKNIGSTSPLG
jgi:hypothetical protein